MDLPSLREKIGYLLFSQTTRDTSIVFTGNGVSSVLAIIFTIVAARALGPSDWGIIAGVASFIGIMTAVGELGLDASMLRFIPSLLKDGKKRAAERIFRVIFTARLSISVVFFTLVVILSPVVSRYVFDINDTRVPVLAALGLFGTLVFDFQIAAAQARQNWRVAGFFISLINILRISLLGVLVAVGRVGFIEVLGIFTMSSIIAYLVSLYWYSTQPKLDFDWRKVYRKIAPFSGWMSLNKIVSTINSRLDVILLIQLAGSYEAGIYSAANRLAMGVPIIIASFATVLAPRFSSFKKMDDLLLYFRKTLGLAVVIVAGLVVGIFIAPFVISLFGEQYARSSLVLQMLLLSFIPFVLGTPAVNVLIYGFRRPKIIALTTIAQLPLILSIDLLLIPKIGVFAPVLAIFATNASMMIVAYFYVFQGFRLKK